MSIIGFADDLRTARAEQIIAKINAGAGPGTMLFYTAPQPAKGAAITTQTLLGTVTFSEPAGSVVDGELTFDVIADDASADADGPAVWVRVLNGDGGFVMDMPVTDTNGTGPVKMPSTQIYAGGTIHVASAVLTEGNI
jgi:hypothetical protein